MILSGERVDTMDPSPHQPNTAARKLSQEECLALIEKLERENAEKDAETNQLKEQLKQKDAEINRLKRAEGFDRLHEQHSTSIELIVSVYPHLKLATQIELLSHLLMLYTSYQEYESQLDYLIVHPSLEVRLVTLIRWFELLYSSIEKTSFDVAIKNGGFTPAKIHANLLTAFSLIIKHANEDLQPFLKQLLTVIEHFLRPERVTLFFTSGDRQALDELQNLYCKHSLLNKPGTAGKRLLNDVNGWITDILSLLPSTSPNHQD
ncbi:hypothetical protein BLNAU_24197 [Blattamonas nauphoetae]|uniref:Uncharacterized protein n=1 Tax=Blattamonas nauphoetae TaxID=2049346 RepID=A0ABQ9WN26_9EUKA|nr:hypothetical protein BLNAU_24197 [Blattamonas nauphoetae]